MLTQPAFARCHEPNRERRTATWASSTYPRQPRAESLLEAEGEEIFTFRIRNRRIMLPGWLGTEGRTRAVRERRYSFPSGFSIHIPERSSPKRGPRGRRCIAGRDRGQAEWFRGRDSVLTCFDKRAPLYGRHETQRRLEAPKGGESSRRLLARPRWPFLGRGKFFGGAIPRNDYSPLEASSFTLPNGDSAANFNETGPSFYLSAVPRPRRNRSLTNRKLLYGGSRRLRRQFCSPVAENCIQHAYDLHG